MFQIGINQIPIPSWFDHHIRGLPPISLPITNNEEHYVSYEKVLEGVAVTGHPC